MPIPYQHRTFRSSGCCDQIIARSAQGGGRLFFAQRTFSWFRILWSSGGVRKFTQHIEKYRLRNCDERTRLAINAPTAAVLITGCLIRFEAGSIALPLLDISNKIFLIHRLGIDTHFFGHFPNYMHSHKYNFLIGIFTVRYCGSTISPQTGKSHQTEQTDDQST
jgi:hypothetical protein